MGKIGGEEKIMGMMVLHLHSVSNNGSASRTSPISMP